MNRSPGINKTFIPSITLRENRSLWVTSASKDGIESNRIESAVCSIPGINQSSSSRLDQPYRWQAIMTQVIDGLTLTVSTDSWISTHVCITVKPKPFPGWVHVRITTYLVMQMMITNKRSRTLLLCMIDHRFLKRSLKLLESTDWLLPPKNEQSRPREWKLYPTIMQIADWVVIQTSVAEKSWTIHGSLLRTGNMFGIEPNPATRTQ